MVPERNHKQFSNEGIILQFPLEIVKMFDKIS